VTVHLYLSCEREPSFGGPAAFARASARTAGLVPRVFMADGRSARSYGMYTFALTGRRKPGPHGVSGVGRGSAETGYRLAISEREHSPAGSARLIVRNASTVPVSWRIEPNGTTGEERSGSLVAGESHIAADVEDDAYAVRFFVDGECVATIPSLGLAPGRDTTVDLVGEPQASADRERLRPVAIQALGVASGAGGAHVTSSAAAIELDDRSAVSVMKPRGTTLAAVDGAADTVTIDRVPDGELRPIVAGVPAEPGSGMQLKVRPITIRRVRDRVSAYRASGDIERATGEDLAALLDRADAHLAGGAPGGACVDLNELLETIRAERGRGISEAAADALVSATRELRADLGC
jgi:hypothetical protein